MDRPIKSDDEEREVRFGTGVLRELLTFSRHSGIQSVSMSAAPQYITIPITLPFTVDTGKFFLGLLVFAVVVLAITYALHAWPKAKAWVLSHRFSERPSVNLAMWFAVVLSPFWLALVAFTLWGTFGLWLQPAGNPVSADGALAYRVHFLALVGLMTALAGLVAAPFTLIKMQTTERQTTAQEEGLITDRINKAVEALGSEKTVKKRSQKKDGSFEVVEETQPNIEVRVGAIYALERIAQDSLRDHIQIMEILCAYIRQNAPASSARTLPQAPEWFEGRDDDGKEWGSLFSRWRSELHLMVLSRKPRLDIQTALTVIGRRGEKQKQQEWGEWKPFEKVVTAWPEWSADDNGAPSARYLAEVEAHKAKLGEWRKLKPKYRLDLRDTNLVGTDMSGEAQPADFSLARFERVEAQEANFSKAEAQGANFGYASLQGARFTGAQVQGAYFDKAHVDTASFGNAQAQRASFCGVQAQVAEFLNTQAQGAAFSGARMQVALIVNAQAQEAQFTYAKAQLACFYKCQAQGADFTETELHSADAKDFDFTQTNASETQINCMFGDSSTIIGAGVVRPIHWPNWNMDWFVFRRERHKWLADKAGYVPPPPPSPAAD